VLQSHVDMVGVSAPGSRHDFLRDPLRPVVRGEWVKATDTSLGADNGIGVALMLALMADAFESVPLEFLFTVNEEAGMTGAKALDRDFVHGRKLINLDGEAFGAFCISCAGSRDMIVHFPVKKEPLRVENTLYILQVSGLKGGHSGGDINAGRMSANKLLVRMLKQLCNKMNIRLLSITGGSQRNVISSQARAVISIPADRLSEAKQAIDSMRARFSQEAADIEPCLRVTMEAAGNGEQAGLTAKATDHLVDMLMALPHGVLAMSAHIPGLVQTSTNMGVIETGDSEVIITMLTRSAGDSAITEVNERIRTIAKFVGAHADETTGYPAWPPALDSPLLTHAQAVYTRLFDAPADVRAVHGGLETAIIGKNIPGMDMISLGPDIRHPHSVKEMVNIASVGKLHRLVKALVKP